MLAEIIYPAPAQETPWRVGRLSRAVAELALVLTIRSDQPTVLVTTNYDDYLERELAALIEERNSHVHHSEQRIRFDVYADISDLPKIEAENTIALVYLHGRIASDGSCSGSVVFSESSYAQQRELVSQRLQELMRDRAFMAVGTSLTDEPLINGLIAERQRSGSRADRIVLLVPPSASTADVTIQQRAHAARASFLGATVLCAPTYSDVAQFLIELRVMIFVKDAEGTERYSASFSYHDRLARVNSRRQLQQEKLQETLDNILDEFDRELGRPNDDELVRAELWTVEQVEADHFGLLQLRATSEAMFVHERVARKEPLQRSSHVAAVKSLNEGRPNYYDLHNDLGAAPTSSRWRSYLCIPIYTDLELHDDADTVKVSGGVVPGVCVIASTLALHSSDDSQSHPVSIFSPEHQRAGNALNRPVQYAQEMLLECICPE